MTGIGISVPRQEAADKVTGAARYNSDFIVPGMLHARLLTSPHAHAEIKAIDVSGAWQVPGVRAVLTGEATTVRCGSVLEDMPPIARGKVRYYGETVAVVVADHEYQAMQAVSKINVEYVPLPVVLSPSDAVKPGAPLVHEELSQYIRAVQDVYPEANSNIADRIQIRKGDMEQGWHESQMVIEANYSLPQSDHIAMETRNASVEILPNGEVNIHSSSQSPYSIRKLISHYFHVPAGKINAHVPLVGGGFGGKAPVTLEPIAFLASRAVGGRMVKLSASREEDMATFPCRIGLQAHVKLGATSEGIIKAAEFRFLVDSGAYANTGPRMAKAMAIDCTGPYNIVNVWCDSLCVYTNHPYVTSYRGFGHLEYTFCIERAMDKLAYALGMDALDLRRKNAIRAQHTTPTQVKLTESNLGNLEACIDGVKRLIRWEEGQCIRLGRSKVRSKGISCFWKTSDSPVDAFSGAILTFAPDGSINLNCGLTEIGPGSKTTMAQILAEKMKMDVDQINVEMHVNSRTSPHHWKTVASMSTYMAGRAVLEAAEDAIRQLKSIAGIALRCTPDDLDVAGGRIFLKSDPDYYLDVTEVMHGYKYPNGNANGGQVIGRGSFIMHHLTDLDQETGRGKPGPAWTVGAQGVEVEYDRSDYSYRLVRAVTVIDVGKVINPKAARGLITGGMCMGLGVASRESFQYDENGVVLNTSLRTYKPMRFGETPEYLVEFIETPQIDAPFGARPMGEHGILGMAPALAGALSRAAETEINLLPIVPELIWRLKGGAMP